MHIPYTVNAKNSWEVTAKNVKTAETHVVVGYQWITNHSATKSRGTPVVSESFYYVLGGTLHIILIY